MRRRIDDVEGAVAVELVGDPNTAAIGVADFWRQHLAKTRSPRPIESRSFVLVPPLRPVLSGCSLPPRAAARRRHTGSTSYRSLVAGNRARTEAHLRTSHAGRQVTSRAWPRTVTGEIARRSGLVVGDAEPNTSGWRVVESAMLRDGVVLAGSPR